ncbi:hypothetical protein [Sphingopyxis sp. A083]|uniref:hypothetical protein n=1 Tax=Sphingopyxis sp. A083 TaxID=1759083 RepID=UPI0012E3BE67|nr:hypothetical protein [Sphingopyxis sp. A083]
MNENTRKTQSYEQKLVLGAERMARRMGGQFKPDQRWSDVVKASTSTRSMHQGDKI